MSNPPAGHSTIIQNGKVVTVPSTIVKGVTHVNGQPVARSNIVATTTASGTTYQGLAKTPTTPTKTTTGSVTTNTPTNPSGTYSSTGHFTPKVTTGSATTTNPHVDWINNPRSGMGGIDYYTQRQIKRWHGAVATNDVDLMQRLQADAAKVGYTLPSPHPTPPPKAVASSGSYSAPPAPKPTPINFNELYGRALGAYKPAMESDVADMLAQMRIHAERRGITHSGIPSELERRAQQQIMGDYARRGMADAFSMAGIDMDQQRMVYDMMDRDRRFNWDVHQGNRDYNLEHFRTHQPYHSMTERERHEWAARMVEAFGRLPGVNLSMVDAEKIRRDLLGY